MTMDMLPLFILRDLFHLCAFLSNTYEILPLHPPDRHLTPRLVLNVLTVMEINLFINSADVGRMRALPSAGGGPN